MDTTKIESGVAKAKELGYSPEEINTFLKKKGLFSPSLNPTYTPEEKKGGFLSNLVGTTALGQRLGGLAYRGTQTDSNISSAIQGNQQIEQQVLQQIQKNKSIGKDTSKLEQALKDLQFSNAQTQQTSQDLRSGGVTNRQVVGSAIQTAASAIPFSSLIGKSATALKPALGSSVLGRGVNTVSKLVKSPVAGAALEGTLGGAAYNFGGAVGEGKSAYDTVVDTAMGGVVGGLGGAALAGTLKGVGKLMNPKEVGTAEDIAGKILDDADKLFGNDANLKSAVLNRELFGVEGDITKAPRIEAFSDLADNLAGRKVISLDNKRAAKTLTGIKGTTVGDGYQVAEQRMAELYKEIDKGLKKSGGDFDKQPIIDFINTKANDYTTSPQALRKLGFTIDKAGNLKIQPRGLIERIMKAGSVADIEKIITEELAPELQSIAQSGLNAPSKSTLAGLRQALNETIDKHITSLGGEYSSIKQKYGAYRGLEDAFKQIITGGNPQLADMIDTYGLSNIVAGRPIKGSIISALNISKRFFNSDNATFRRILESAGEFNKAKMNPIADAGAAAAKAVPELPPPGIAPAGEEAVKFMETLSDEQKTMLQKLLGEKKNLNSGFSKLSTILTAAGITGVGAAGAAAARGKTETIDVEAARKAKEVSPAKTEDADGVDIRNGFIHSENRGAASSSKDLYKEVGVTGDLGKYQVKPQTLKEWSVPWLGKTYKKEEFLNDPKAQEEFMNQFEAVVKAYKLSPEDAAVIWHKGWGVLGDQKPRSEKEKLLRQHIEEKKKDPNVQEYIRQFKIGLENVKI